MQVALELARRVAWNIRYDLVPLFGTSFLDSCLVRSSPPAHPPAHLASSHPPTAPIPPVEKERARPVNAPISPITTCEPTSHAQELFESPLDSNVPIPAERVFDVFEPDDAVYTAQSEQRGRAYTYPSGQVHYPSHAQG
jgi:hypothetical protein